MKKFFLATVFMLGLIGGVKADNLLIVGEDEIREAIEEEFIEQGQDKTLDLEFFSGQTMFHIENAQKAKVLVSGLKIDELQNKFSCSVEIFADGKAYARTSVMGKFYIMGEIYVPSKNILKGEIISPEALKVLTVRMNRVKPNFLIEKEQLVNKEAKKVLKEGKIVLDREVGSKVLIKKGDIVTVVYKTNMMQITAKVEALGGGSKGDKIEMLNPKSKKVLYGEIIDRDTVIVEMQ